MSVRTCSTPEEGWKLYGTLLASLERIEEEREWARLIGILYAVARRMKTNGYDSDAAVMLQLVDMVVDGDLANPKICGEIRAALFDFKIARISRDQLTIRL